MRIFYTCLFVLICCLNFSDSIQANPTMRIATYNIWNPLFEERYTQQNTWDKRCPYIIENILNSESDVICLQEVNKDAFLSIIQDHRIHSRYLSFYISHAPSKEGQTEGRDGLCILYNPLKVNFLKLVQSEKHLRPTHRRDFYVDFTSADLSKVNFRIATTHLDSGKDLHIGNLQLSNLVSDVLNNDSKIDFVVVCGDFNEGESELERPRYEILNKVGFFTDGSFASTRPEALNVRHHGHVDWISFKKLSDLKFMLIPIDPIGDEKASDHKLTMTDVEFDK